jgi:hypothetical protein
MRGDALHWSLMACSRRRKWLVMVATGLAVMYAAVLFVLPKRHGASLEPLYARVRIGMDAEDVRRLYHGWADLRLVPNDVWTTSHGNNGEELIIRFGPDSRVIRTEYHEGSSLAGKLRDSCQYLAEYVARILRW